MQKYFILPISIIVAFAIMACQSHETNSDVVVEIRRAETGLLAEYHLPEPIAKFVLIGNDQSQRQDGWTITGEGWEFDGVEVSRTTGENFEDVTFLINPEKKFYDRKYVVLDKIGDNSWMIYISAFKAFERSTRIKFRLDNLDDIVRIGANSVANPEAGVTIEDGSQQAYFGRASNVAESEAILIAGPEIPKPFRDKITGDVGRTIRQLSKVFNERPQQKPTLYITTGEHISGWSSKGGLLDDNVMTFHYRGIELDIDDEKLLENVANSAAHEAAHSWLGGLYKNHRNEEESWVHEGGAEYLADRTRNDTADIKDELETRLNRCIAKLGDRALDGRDGYVQGAEAYDCGYVLNGMAETAAYSQAKGHIGDIWQTVFSNTPAEGYKPMDFIAESVRRSGEPYNDFAQLFLAPRTDTAWSELPSLSKQLGVTLEPIDENTGDARTLASLWLFPFLGEHCTNGYGYYANEDHFQLDTKTGCADAISNKPRVISVGAHNLIKDPYAAYTYAKEVCSSQAEFDFGLLGGGRTKAIQCKINVKPIPPRFAITALPDLPPL